MQDLPAECPRALRDPGVRGGAGDASSRRSRWAGCGVGLSGVDAADAPGAERPTKVTLILDFTPNAVHAGIYRALAAGYYRRENIDLQVIAAELDAAKR